VLPAPPGIKQHSLSNPVDLAISSDGATLYVAALGSSKVGVISTAALESGAFDPTTASAAYLPVSGGGPCGVVLDEARGRLYVATSYDDGVSAIDLASRKELAHVVLANPRSERLARGRRFLYDADLSSSNGEVSCASCHLFGDHDGLAWDLGDADDEITDSPIPVKLAAGAPRTINATGDVHKLHPLKGPMITQTMRGLVNHGPMHWRGDRVSGEFGTDTRTRPPYDSTLAFNNFILGFPELLGRDGRIANDDMKLFTEFSLALVLPPSPVRNLDNSVTAAQARGKRYFLGCDGLDSSTHRPVTCDGGRPTGTGHLSDSVPGAGFTCEGCHVLDPARGFFGTDGQSSYEALPQIMKIPQLRNLYDKVGMFGLPANALQTPGDNQPTGAQLRGFGFQHDGAVDTLFHFLKANVFEANHLARDVGFTGGDPQRRDVEQYLLAFDSDLAPIVGQQVTLRADNAAAAGPRIDLLIARALTPFASQILPPGATECDLVVRGVIAGQPTTLRLGRDRQFTGLGAAGHAFTDAAVRALAATAGQELTYTCLPPGWLDGPPR
jgi:hypothetical protein